MIDTYFDSVMCINLDRRADRWAEAVAELRLCEITRYCHFAAVDDAQDYRGCMASHLTVWRRIASGILGERVLILEDDFKSIARGDLLGAGYTEDSAEVCIFDSCPGATPRERFDAISPSIPSYWDLLYLGGSYMGQPRARVNKYIIRNRGMSCGHAYGMSRLFAQNIAAFFLANYPKDDCNEAPDKMLWLKGQNPCVFSYTLSPRLFAQRHTSSSDLVPRPPGFPHTMVEANYELF
jgi:hypothetical protein